MNWIKATPESIIGIGEVLAVNSGGEFIVGHLILEEYYNKISCVDESTKLPDVTHFIEVKNLSRP